MALSLVLSSFIFLQASSSIDPKRDYSSAIVWVIFKVLSGASKTRFFRYLYITEYLLE
jgi:hypothetical protein